jgi:hypothetical protein
LRALFLLASLLPATAHASFLSGDTLDSAASFIAWVVIFVVPVVVVALFWIVHILPEKIAEKKHHPQQGAIKVLCFLSLVFGGMLWPLAWLWAYTRPVAYRASYGTEKHEHYFLEMAKRAAAGELDELELVHLRDEVATMAEAGPLPAAIRHLPAELAQARPRQPEPPAGAAQAAGGAR